MDSRHQLVIDMYREGKSSREILAATGYKSKQSIYNVLDANGLAERKNISLSDDVKPAIIERWLNDVTCNTRSLANEFGCSAPQIAGIISEQVPCHVVDMVTRLKQSNSTKNRKDIHESGFTEKAVAALRGIPLTGYRLDRLLVGVENSVKARKGVPLTKEHRDKLSLSHVGLMAGDKHPNWNGGTSKICWRGPGWAQARREARQRDANTCMACGKSALDQGRAMDVHHRISYFKFDSAKQANDLSNLVCLCRSCHRKVENRTIECPA
jgi:hypothetical protein